MKVLHIPEHYSPDFGGAEAVTEAWIDTLVADGHHVEVVTSYGAYPNSPPQSVERGVAVHRLQVRNAALTNNLQELLLVRRQIREHLTRFEPDLVHLSVLGPLCMLAIQELNRVAVPVVVSAQGIESQTGAPSASQAAAFRRATRVIAVSEGVRRWVERADASIVGDDLASNVTVIRNSLPLPVLDRVTPSVPTVLFAGRLAKQKGVEVLMRSFAAVTQRHPDAQLQIAGAGPCEAELRSMASDLGVAANVQFLGVLDRPSVMRCMQAATVLAVPSLSMEGYPLVIVEAGHAGCCTVATEIPGIDEMITNGADGFLVAPGDDRALADALLEACQAEVSDRVGAALQRRAVAEWSFGALADGYRAVYAAAVAQ